MSDLLKSLCIAALLTGFAPVAFAQELSESETSSEAAPATGSESTSEAESDDGDAEQATEPPQDSSSEGTAEAGVEPGQEVLTPTDPGTLNMGEPAAPEDEGTADAAAGTTYVAEQFGDWEQRCVRRTDGTDPCQIYQLLRDAEGNAVAEMSVFPLPAGQPAVAGSTIITPLETLLPKNITISIDGGQARRYPFEFCTTQGCLSRVGFAQSEVDQFKRGAAGRMTIFPAAAPDTPINLTISLSGFTAAFESVIEANTTE